MHIAQRKELDVHKTKQKRDRNRTTTSLVLDSSMQRGKWEFRLNQRIWLRLSSVFESRQISFFKIFLVHAICVICLFFPNSDTKLFSQNDFRNTIIVSNSLDTDQASHFVGPDLGPNCLQRLSADDR